VDPDAPVCDYAVLWKPPAELFERQRRLKAMFSLGAGVNGLLAMPSLPRDIPLVRMEDGGMADQMVEYAMYVALREFRQFPEYQHNQSQACWVPRTARARKDFSIGVLGLGVLGGMVARTLADFGFAVSGWSRSEKAIASVRCEHGVDGLNAVLSRSELLMLFLPLTGETENLIDRTRLAQLPLGAAVVNLSRGELIDDGALLDAVDSALLARAYLDVFREEPLPPDHPFWRHHRVEITPHVAALTDAHVACAQIARKIRRLEAGDTISGVVDRSRGY
jgi:glyoxylate/hydroxypyruvate reductase A